MPGGPLAPSKRERFFLENDDLPCQIGSFHAENRFSGFHEKSIFELESNGFGWFGTYWDIPG